MMTERLGQSRSPLTVEELLEALSDPRFNVRFEAIISIARREPDPRLTGALCKVLERDEPALGVVAAWALGRLGDREALDCLRGALDAPYRSIQAHSARSLGTLEDEALMPLLMDRLAEEEDLGLKVAFSSALGKLKAEEAVPDMLALLYLHEDRYLQLEIALALARILEEEHLFINLLRGVRSDPGTTLSQESTELMKKYQAELSQEQIELISQAADSFAHNDLDNGVNQLVSALEAVSAGGGDTTATVVAEECHYRLKTFQSSRWDYLILFFICHLHSSEVKPAA
jgi:HEAT repeat protein